MCSSDLEMSRAQQSIDGTSKWLLKLVDGNEVESVHIPEEDRGTLCVSSQVGCTLTCKFCHTGTQRLVRNLTAPEIVQQVLVARDKLGEWPAPPDGRRSTPAWGSTCRAVRRTIPRRSIRRRAGLSRPAPTASWPRANTKR